MVTLEGERDHGAAAPVGAAIGEAVIAIDSWFSTIRFQIEQPLARRTAITGPWALDRRAPKVSGLAQAGPR